MIFGKKKNKAPAEEEVVVAQNPIGQLKSATGRLWTAMDAMDQAVVQYECAISAAHDNELAKYDKAVNAARREMKTAQFCVREVFGSLLDEITH